MAAKSKDDLKERVKIAEGYSEDVDKKINSIARRTFKKLVQTTEIQKD